MVNPGKSDSTTMQQKKHLDCTSWHVVRSKFGGLQLFLVAFRIYTSCKACVSLAKSPTAHQLHRGPSHPSLSVKESLLFGGFALNCCRLVVNLHDVFVAFFKQVCIHIINLNHFTYEYLYSCTRSLALFSLGSTCMLHVFSDKHFLFIQIPRELRTSPSPKPAAHWAVASQWAPKSW